jgi:hypothetical protein
MKKFISFKTIFTLMVAMAVFVASVVFAVSCEYDKFSTKSWKFGVMGDTQWTIAADPTGNNPNGVSLSIIDQINKQFISKDVKFVIQVGDLTENGQDSDIAVRAAAAEALYSAGIGFFPMRGNHETYAKASNGYAIAAFRTNFPQTQCLSKTFGARHCNSPSSVSADLTGMSYSFDYGWEGNNARFVIIDDWATPSKKVDAAGYLYGYSISDQQSWISSRLDKNSRNTLHSFVFSHQQPMGENHQDSLFSGYADANPDMQNAYFACLRDNNIRYHISGHDHIHQRSIIVSPDSNSNIQELICASNSSKFYTPKPLTDAKWYNQKRRETSVSQELYTVGFYIFTIDGPRVTVDYYSDDHGNWQSDESYPAGPTGAGSHITPMFNFVKKETWGYSLNGKEFLVAQGQSYSVVQDRHSGTMAKIIDGFNISTTKDGSGRNLTKTIDTGWSQKTQGIDSDILTLWGMADLGTEQTDVFTLSLSYDEDSVNPKDLNNGLFGMVTKDALGNWINAVSQNFGGTKKFVDGPWKSGYTLGTYGVDQNTHTVWAVINHNSDFAAAKFNEKCKEHHEE